MCSLNRDRNPDAVVTDDGVFEPNQICIGNGDGTFGTDELDVMGRVLEIVCRAMATRLINKAELTRANTDTGAVTLIQRFGSALNLNVHFHILFLDGVYITAQRDVIFRRVKPHTSGKREKLIHWISHRVGRYPEQPRLHMEDLGFQLPHSGNAR